MSTMYEPLQHFSPTTSPSISKGRCFPPLRPAPVSWSPLFRTDEIPSNARARTFSSGSPTLAGQCCRINFQMTPDSLDNFIIKSNIWLGALKQKAGKFCHSIGRPPSTMKRLPFATGNTFHIIPHLIQPIVCLQCTWRKNTIANGRPGFPKCKLDKRLCAPRSLSMTVFLASSPSPRA